MCFLVIVSASEGGHRHQIEQLRAPDGRIRAIQRDSSEESRWTARFLCDSFERAREKRKAKAGEGIKATQTGCQIRLHIVKITGSLRSRGGQYQLEAVYIVTIAPVLPVLDANFDRCALP